MSTDLSISNMPLPAHLRTVELDATTKALMGGEGSNSHRISIRGRVFRMVANGKEVAASESNSMNVVIVAAAEHVARVFYAGQYDPNAEASAPDCWSADGVTPNPQAKNVQATKCADCPNNIAGSGQNGSRACRYRQRIAVLLENDPRGDVYQLDLAATSIFGDAENGRMPLQAYGRFLGAQGIPVSAVVTEMKFDINADTPKLTFKPVSYLESDAFMNAMEKGKSEAAKRCITMTVATPRATQAAIENKEEFASAPTPAVEAPKVQAPEPAPVVQAAEPEPVVVQQKKEEPAIAPKADVASILPEWDDE
jgi:hypothetical protein